MTTLTFDLMPILNCDKGQRFDRKSMFEDEGGQKRGRDHLRMRDQVEES